jgi:hypothetical protein
VPCSPLHRARELAYEIGQSGAKVLVCLEESLELVHATRDKTSLEHIIVTKARDFSPEEPPLSEIPGTVPLRKVIGENGPLAEPVAVNRRRTWLNSCSRAEPRVCPRGSCLRTTTS